MNESAKNILQYWLDEHLLLHIVSSENWHFFFVSDLFGKKKYWVVVEFSDLTWKS